MLPEGSGAHHPITLPPKIPKLPLLFSVQSPAIYPDPQGCRHGKHHFLLLLSWQFFFFSAPSGNCTRQSIRLSHHLSVVLIRSSLSRSSLPVSLLPHDFCHQRRTAAVTAMIYYDKVQPASGSSESTAMRATCSKSKEIFKIQSYCNHPRILVRGAIAPVVLTTTVHRNRFHSRWLGTLFLSKSFIVRLVPVRRGAS